MQNQYARIACSIGKTIRLSDIRDEALPERLSSLLDRLEEEEDRASRAPDKQEAPRRRERAERKRAINA